MVDLRHEEPAHADTHFGNLQNSMQAERVLRTIAEMVLQVLIPLTSSKCWQASRLRPVYVTLRLSKGLIGFSLCGRKSLLSPFKFFRAEQIVDIRLNKLYL